MKRFRFSHNVFGIQSRHNFAEKCRRAERQGYDRVFASDHLGVTAPCPALVAAAVTQQLRVGTLVLAREIATTDVLTGGRLEVGLARATGSGNSTKPVSSGDPSARQSSALRR